MIYVGRKDWRAAHGVGYATSGAKGLVILHHSWIPDEPCGSDRETESARLRGMEDYHAAQGWGGISYNWLVFQTGRIWEGRGWGRVGAHTHGQNSRSVGVCLVINGDSRAPTDAAVEAVREIISQGIRAGHIARDFRLRGHADFSAKSCPGALVIAAFGRIVPAAGVRMPSVDEGDRGPAVASLQSLLGIAADGIFGGDTHAAVLEFQRAAGLEADGIVGPETWAALTGRDSV